jgi:hypothetical protein
MTAHVNPAQFHPQSLPDIDRDLARIVHLPNALAKAEEIAGAAYDSAFPPPVTDGQVALEETAEASDRAEMDRLARRMTLSKPFWSA